MIEHVTRKVTLTPSEVMAAIKSAYPTNLVVQSIPKDAKAELVGTHGLVFSWTRAPDAPPELQPQTRMLSFAPTNAQ